jgi:peptidoglycan/xylan/chitin deacetylase (PgdA/CDA1 family)
MIDVLRRGTSFLDRQAARLGSRFERPGLLSFVFHPLFESEAEVRSGLIHPQEAATKQAFRYFLEHFLSAGYRFVSPSDVENGLEANGKYGCLTFDDGYANNLRILDTLREYGVPATIFVSTAHVAEGKRFWWDAIYAERRRRGASAAAIDREIESLKSRTFSVIEAYIEREFGRGSSVPRGDLDRPLTPHELKALASDELVTIGNHTTDHAILTTLDSVQIREQIVGAQRYLHDMIGREVRTIVYPNGGYNATVLQIARDAGLTCGFSGIRRKEAVPVPRDRLLELGRFQLRRGLDRDQMRLVRSEVPQLTNALRRLRNRSPRELLVPPAHVLNG